MFKVPKQAYTAEFKTAAVQRVVLVQISGAFETPACNVPLKSTNSVGMRLSRTSGMGAGPGAGTLRGEDCTSLAGCEPATWPRQDGEPDRLISTIASF